VIAISILVVSSKIAEGRDEDQGKKSLSEMVESIPARLLSYEVVSDVAATVRERLLGLCGSAQADVILTIGGTGVRPTDVVPEITREIGEKEIPGIGEAMRQESLKKVQTAMLSRGTAVIRGKTLIVNLPGNPRGAKENLNVVLPVLEHTIEKIQGR
jgi:molybdenum cofactor synthesis domain-containing protein